MLPESGAQVTLNTPSIRPLPWPACALVWAAGYALVLVLARIVILQALGPGGLGSLLSLPGLMLEGLLLGAPLFAWKRAAWVVMPLLFVLIFVSGIMLQYEAVLGAPPGASVILVYLGQLGHVASSLASGGRPFWFAAEVLVAWSILLVLYLVLRKRSGGAARRASVLAAAGALLGGVLWTVAIHANPDLLGSRHRWSVRTPLAALLASAWQPASSGSGGITRQEVAELQIILGLEPFASGAPAAPLCGARERQARREANGRSVILVIVESVGELELEARPDGRWLLPNLRRIAASGFSARRFHAVGTQTCQALPALFSGQPAQPWDVLFWRTPLPRFRGFPQALEKRGYRTAYFHGAGLGFEQKRAYLEMVGFDVMHELHDEDPSPRYGWGLSDGEMFSRTRRWIEMHAQESPDVPYLMAFATLSGHHPYEVPDDWPRRFGGSQHDLFHETLAYMDAQLGVFYDWYLERERGRGTYLVIVSDHAPLIVNTEAISEGRPLRFDSVFMVVGPDADESEGWEPFEGRLASQLDVPATIGGLLGVHPGPCDQGLDLLSEDWPAERLIVGSGGRGLDELYLWDRTLSVRFERGEERITVLDADVEPARQEVRLLVIERFIELFLPLAHHLIEADAHAPPG
ncbi:MAG: LTA synthase family protein [Deltaproteobacteria bacterium]|nr:LTA synthase family protein [Deltaproteobacteria bacterium]